VIPVSSGPGVASWVVPSDGVITGYSHRAFTIDPGVQVRMLLVRQVDANNWSVAAKSAYSVPTASSLNTFPVRLPAHAGETLALGILNGTATTACGTSATATVHSSTDDPDDGGITTGTGFADVVADISAVLEPDADKDGFGDLTQDACPSVATLQTACPVPETALQNGPSKHSHQRRTKVTFTSSVAGSTFRCTLDKDKAVTCASPFTVRVGLGKHKLTIQAVANTIADPTPLVLKWKVKRKSR